MNPSIACMTAMNIEEMVARYHIRHWTPRCWLVDSTGILRRRLIILMYLQKAAIDLGGS